MSRNKKSFQKNQNSSENDGKEKQREAASADLSIGSNESYSKYVSDRTAPSFFMILAEQEISRQESMDENELSNANQQAVVLDQSQLDDKLKNLEEKKEEDKVSPRENVRFLSQEIILGPNEPEEESHQSEQDAIQVENQPESDHFEVAESEIHTKEKIDSIEQQQPVVIKLGIYN